VPFSRALLNKDEEIVLDLKPHPWFMARPSAALVVSLIVGITVYANSEDAGIGTGLRWLVVAFIVFSIVWFVQRYLAWISTQFVLTNDRVIHREGVIAKKSIEFPLERINTVMFNQNIFERMIGAGDLGIESAGERGIVTFEDVRKPSIVQNEIYRQMEANNTRMYGGMRGPAPTQPATDASIPDQIERLDDLRKRGLISDQEFATKKAELLNRM
jgi:membrane protein YdbS with pleckstrin-like domain